jgi:uncharacterized damage-inducible protein DinB
MVKGFDSDFLIFCRERLELDEIILKLVQKLSENDYISREIDSYDSKGNKIKQKINKCLLMLFNHQTHHRGKVSVILDQLNIENDVSAIAWE